VEAEPALRFAIIRHLGCSIEVAVLLGQWRMTVFRGPALFRSAALQACAVRLNA
jgi:hypothetical protein